nr:MAG TPA: hypothetical protein [Caudoviricetes sp.]
MVSSSFSNIFIVLTDIFLYLFRLHYLSIL